MADTPQGGPYDAFDTNCELWAFTYKQEGAEGLRQTLEALRDKLETMPMSEQPFGMKESLLEDAAELRRLRLAKPAKVIEAIAPTFSSQFDPKFCPPGWPLASWLKHQEKLVRYRRQRWFGGVQRDYCGGELKAGERDLALSWAGLALVDRKSPQPPLMPDQCHWLLKIGCLTAGEREPCGNALPDSEGFRASIRLYPRPLPPRPVFHWP